MKNIIMMVMSMLLALFTLPACTTPHARSSSSTYCGTRHVEDHKFVRPQHRTEAKKAVVRVISKEAQRVTRKEDKKTLPKTTAQKSNALAQNVPIRKATIWVAEPKIAVVSKPHAEAGACTHIADIIVPEKSRLIGIVLKASPSILAIEAYDAKTQEFLGNSYIADDKSFLVPVKSCPGKEVSIVAKLAPTAKDSTWIEIPSCIFQKGEILRPYYTPKRVRSIDIKIDAPKPLAPPKLNQKPKPETKGTTALPLARLRQGKWENVGYALCTIGICSTTGGMFLALRRRRKKKFT